METTLDYIVPVTVGPGTCTFALVDFLVLAHNDFIERCRGILQDSNLKSVEEEKLL